MGRLEQIRGAVNDLDDAFAKDVLSILLSQGGEGSVYDRAGQRTSQAAASGVSGLKSTDNVDFANFAQAITYLKNRFKFKELSRFTTEVDLVYVDTGDRKVLLTDRDDPARFVNQNVNRRPVEDSYSSEDEYFENAFEPSYHRSSNSNKAPSNPAQQNSSETVVASNNASVEKTYQNSDNNNSANSTPAPESPQPNSRFSSLEF